MVEISTQKVLCQSPLLEFRMHVNRDLSRGFVQLFMQVSSRWIGSDGSVRGSPTTADATTTAEFVVFGAHL